MSLYNKVRPATLDAVLGNEPAITALRVGITKEERVQVFLIEGDPGCGKTTLARIAARMLGAGPMDTHEYNCAKLTGKDDMDEITDTFRALPSSDASVYILDEVHELSKKAWSTLLKPLEEPPGHVFVFLLTSEVTKVPVAQITRAVKLRVAPLSDRDAKRLLNRTCGSEGFTVSPGLRDAIIRVSQGSSRLLLTNLEKVVDAMSGGSTEAEATGLLSESTEENEDIKSLYKALEAGGDWIPCVRSLKSQKDAEGVRRAILAYASAVYRASRKPSAMDIMQVFTSGNLFDTGDAGLDVMCDTVCKLGRGGM